MQPLTEQPQRNEEYNTVKSIWKNGLKYYEMISIEELN